MIKLKVRPHEHLAGKEMVEVWRDGVFVAGIYPHEDGLRIVTKYMGTVTLDNNPWPPAVVVKLEKKPVPHKEVLHDGKRKKEAAEG